jgi:hypothetical protein
MRGREDNVADFFVFPARRAMAVQFLDRDRLAIHVFVALGLRLTFAVGHQLGQIRRRLAGGLCLQQGRREHGC